MGKSVKLTNNEIRFIKWACNNATGVYNFDQSDEDFREQYGITKIEADEMIKNLYSKIK